MHDDTHDHQQNRRSFLKALGATGLATSLAGCSGLPQTTYSFTAHPCGISKEDVERLGFLVANEDEFTVTRRPSVGDLELEVTVTSQIATYGVDRDAKLGTDWSVDEPGSRSTGVLSTPEAAVMGQKLNPLATTALDELVTTDLGRDLLVRAGVAEGEDLAWRRAPERVATTESRTLESGTELGTYAGVAAGETDTVVLFHLARVTHDADAVLAAVVQRRTVPTSYEGGPIVGPDGPIGDPDLREKIEFAEDVLDRIRCFGGGSTDYPEPGVSLSNVRLVQTVEDTQVTNGGSFTVGDPPLIAGHNVAPVFDLSVDNPDDLAYAMRITVYQRTPTDLHSYHCEIPKAQVVDVANGSDLRGEFHENARNGNSDDDLPVFPIDEDVVDVTVKVSAPTTNPTYDSVDLREGTDFEVITLDPLRVGFVDVRDPDKGDNYGNGAGWSSDYYGTVEAAVEYLKRTYPGGLIAYREDATGIVGRKSSVDASAWKDYKWAKSYLDSRPAESNFPNDGTVFTYGVSRSSAIQQLESDGFDVTVMLAPGDVAGGDGKGSYYDYHYKNPPGGLFPGSHNAAVSSLEAGDRRIGYRWTASTIAQEIGHFMEGEPYRDDAVQHPLAQRDDGGVDKINGANVTVNGEPIDWDHARDEDSDRNGDGNVDKPGVRSTGYDLTDGRFSVVTGFSFSGTDFQADAPPTNGGKYAVGQLQSYMSYAGGSLWGDSRITRDMIGSGYWAGGGTGTSSGPQPVLTAVGHVEDGGDVTYEETLSTQGYPAKPDQEREEDAGRSRPVTVSLVDPNGKAVTSTQVPDTVHLHHHVYGDLNVVQFTLPFPRSVAEVRTSRNRRITRFNAITRPVRDALDRVPEGAFVTDSDRMLRDANDILDRVASLMGDRAYRKAAEVVRKELRPLVAEGTTDDVEAALNEPTKTGLLGLLDDVDDRLRTLDEISR